LVGKKEDWCVIIAAESIGPLARRVEMSGAKVTYVWPLSVQTKTLEAFGAKLMSRFVVTDAFVTGAIG
jgi:hypothetical protein